MSTKWSVRENIRNIFGSTQLNSKSSLSPSTSHFRGLEPLFIISRESRVLLPVRPGRFWPRHINLEAGMTEICWLFPHYWWWRSVCQYKLLTIIHVFYGGPVPPQDTKIDDSGKFGKQYCIRREKYNCYLILMRWEVLLNIIRGSGVLVLKNLLVLSRCLLKLAYWQHLKGNTIPILK